MVELSKKATSEGTLIKEVKIPLGERDQSFNVDDDPDFSEKLFKFCFQVATHNTPVYEQWCIQGHYAKGDPFIFEQMHSSAPDREKTQNPIQEGKEKISFVKFLQDKVCFERHKFIELMKHKQNTLIDSFLMIGPSDEIKMAELAEKLKYEYPQQIANEFKEAEIEPKVISKYPDFGSKIAFDNSLYDSLFMYAYQRDYSLKVQMERPEDVSVSAGFANNNTKFASCQMLTIYEDLEDYRLAYLDYNRIKQQEKLTKSKHAFAKLKTKEDLLAGCKEDELMPWHRKLAQDYTYEKKLNMRNAKLIGKQLFDELDSVWDKATALGRKRSKSSPNPNGKLLIMDEIFEDDEQQEGDFDMEEVFQQHLSTKKTTNEQQNSLSIIIDEENEEDDKEETKSDTDYSNRRMFVSGKDVETSKEKRTSDVKSIYDHGNQPLQQYINPNKFPQHTSQNRTVSHNLVLRDLSPNQKAAEQSPKMRVTKKVVVQGSASIASRSNAIDIRRSESEVLHKSYQKLCLQNTEKVRELEHEISTLESQLDEIEIETQSCLKRKQNQRVNKVWVPKTLALFSISPYNDIMQKILEDLVQKYRDTKGMSDVFEAYIFKIIYEIPNPLKKVINYNNILIKQVDTFQLPYVPDMFYQTLFSKLEVNTIINIFTHLLCQTPVIIAAKTIYELTPIHQALKELIYPFIYAISAPCVHNTETPDDDDNEMSHVINICPVFNGILWKDIPVCERIIKSNQFEYAPLLIDLTLPEGHPEKYRLIEYRKTNNQNVRVVGLYAQREEEAKRERENIKIMLPKKVRKELKDEIYRQLPKGDFKPEDIKSRNIENIRDKFFQIIVGLFFPYSKYIGHDQGLDVFKVKEFINYFNFDNNEEEVKSFYKRFFGSAFTVENQSFLEFLQLNSTHADVQLQLRKQHFDIIAKHMLQNDHKGIKSYVETEVMAKREKKKLENITIVSQVLPRALNQNVLEYQDFKKVQEIFLSDVILPNQEPFKLNPLFNEQCLTRQEESLAKLSTAESASDSRTTKISKNYFDSIENSFSPILKQEIIWDLREKLQVILKEQLSNFQNLSPMSTLKQQELLSKYHKQSMQRFRYRLLPPLRVGLMKEYEASLDLNGKGFAFNMLTSKEDNITFENPQIPSTLQEERTWVYLSWIYIWCGTLGQQCQGEKLFRTNQLLQVVQKLKAKSKMLPDANTMFIIFYVICKSGYFKMTKKVYEKMQALNISSSNQIYLKYFEHQQKDFFSKTDQKKKLRKLEKEKKNVGLFQPQKKYSSDSLSRPTESSTQTANKDEEQLIHQMHSSSPSLPQQQHLSMTEQQQQQQFVTQDARQKLIAKKEEQLLDSSSKLCRQIKYQFQFRKRTFKTKEMQEKNLINVEQVRLKLEEQCNLCSGQLLASQLRKTILKVKQDCNQMQTKVICTFCGGEIDRPFLNVTVGKRVRVIDKKGVDEEFKEYQPSFLSAKELYENLKCYLTQNRFEVDLEEFRSEKKHEERFWNLIYYFNEYHLPFEFMLPYLDKKQQHKFNQYKKNSKKRVDIQQQKERELLNNSQD